MFVRITLQQFIENFAGVRDLERLLFDVLAGRVDFDYRAPSGSGRIFQLSSRPGKLYTPVFVGFSVDDYIKCYGSQRWDVLRVLFASADEQRRQDADVKAHLQASQQEFIDYLFHDVEPDKLRASLEDMLINHQELFNVLFNAIHQRDTDAKFVKALQAAMLHLLKSQRYSVIQKLINNVTNDSSVDNSHALSRVIGLALFNDSEMAGRIEANNIDFLQHDTRVSELDERVVSDIALWVERFSELDEISGLFKLVKSDIGKYIEALSADKLLTLMDNLVRRLSTQPQRLMLRQMFISRLDGLDFEPPHLDAFYQLVFCSNDGSLQDDAIDILAKLLLSERVSYQIKVELFRRLIADGHTAVLHRVGIQALAADQDVMLSYIQALIDDNDVERIEMLIIDSANTKHGAGAIDSNDLRVMLNVLLEHGTLSDAVLACLFSMGDTALDDRLVVRAFYDGIAVRPIFTRVMGGVLTCDGGNQQAKSQLFAWLQSQFEAASHNESDRHVVHDLMRKTIAAMGIFNHRRDLTPEGQSLVMALEPVQLHQMLNWFEKVPPGLICHILNSNRLSEQSLMHALLRKLDNDAMEAVILYVATQARGSEVMQLDSSTLTWQDCCAFIDVFDNCVLAYDAIKRISASGVSDALMRALFKRAQILNTVDRLVDRLSGDESFMQHMYWHGLQRTRAGYAPSELYKNMMMRDSVQSRYFQYACYSKCHDYFHTNIFASYTADELVQNILDTVKSFEDAATLSDRDRYMAFLLENMASGVVGSVLDRAVTKVVDDMPLMQRLFQYNVETFGDSAQRYNSMLIMNYYSITKGVPIPAEMLGRFLSGSSGDLRPEFIANLLRQAIDYRDDATACTLIDRYSDVINFEQIYLHQHELDGGEEEAKETILSYALRSESSDAVVSRLVPHTRHLDETDQHNESALAQAIKQRRYDVVYRLVKYGQVKQAMNRAGSPYHNALTLAIESGSLDIVHCILQESVAYGLKYIDYRAQYYASDDTILHLAVRQGSAGMLNALLSHQCFRSIINVANAEGLTPLALACKRGDMSIAETLLRSGARNDLVEIMPEKSAAGRLLDGVVSLFGSSSSSQHRPASYYAKKSGCIAEFSRLVEKTPAVEPTMPASGLSDMQQSRDAAVKILSTQLLEHDHTRSSSVIRLAIANTLQSLRCLKLESESPHSMSQKIMDIVDELAQHRYSLEGDREHSYLSTSSRRAFESLGYTFENFPINSAEKALNLVCEAGCFVMDMLDDGAPPYRYDDLTYRASRLMKDDDMSEIGASSIASESPRVSLIGVDASAVAEPMRAYPVVPPVASPDVVDGYAVAMAMPVVAEGSAAAVAYPIMTAVVVKGDTAGVPVAPTIPDDEIVDASPVDNEPYKPPVYVAVSKAPSPVSADRIGGYDYPCYSQDGCVSQERLESPLQAAGLFYKSVRAAESASPQRPKPSAPPLSLLEESEGKDCAVASDLKATGIFAAASAPLAEEEKALQAIAASMPDVPAAVPVIEQHSRPMRVESGNAMSEAAPERAMPA